MFQPLANLYTLSKIVSVPYYPVGSSFNSLVAGNPLYFQPDIISDLNGKQITAIKLVTDSEASQMPSQFANGIQTTLTGNVQYQSAFLYLIDSESDNTIIDALPVASLAPVCTQGYMKQFNSAFNWKLSYIILSDTTGFTVGQSMFFEVFYQSNNPQPRETFRTVKNAYGFSSKC